MGGEVGRCEITELLTCYIKEFDILPGKSWDSFEGLYTSR